MADMIVVLIIALFIFIGYRKGFAKTLISALSNIISIAFSIMLTGPVSKLIFNSPLGELINNRAISAIEGNIRNAGLTKAAVEMAADGITMLASSAISFILIAVVVKIAVLLIAQAVDIVAKLPFIRQANNVLGAVLGAVSGIVICYVLIGIVYVLGDKDIIKYGMLLSSLENSMLCSPLYYNNLVANVLLSIA